VQARQRVAALDVPLVAHLRTDAFTVVVTGGAYWTMGLYGVLKHLASYSSSGGSAVFSRPANQILVVCGHNTRAYRAYRQLRHATGLNVIPLPFLPAEQLAAVFRSADATILASVAPATLYELMAAKAGPLLVHRINPGPEQWNLSFLLHHHLAHYLPNPQELRHVLLRLSTSPQLRADWQQAFWQAAERECTAARERARQNAHLIVHVAAPQEACPSGWPAADGHEPMGGASHLDICCTTFHSACQEARRRWLQPFHGDEDGSHGQHVSSRFSLGSGDGRLPGRRRYL
jgi:hypothetical protein